MHPERAPQTPVESWNPQTPEKIRNLRPSRYQAAIGDALQNGGEHLVIQACAGSGKTTSMEWIVWRFLHLLGEVLFLAFNRSIAGELAERFRNLRDVNVSTLNAAGHRAVAYWVKRERGVSEITLDEAKVRKLVAEMLPVEDMRAQKEAALAAEDYAQAENLQERIDYRFSLRSALVGLADLCRCTLRKGSREDIAYLAHRYGIEVEGVETSDLVELLPQVLDECLAQAERGVLDFNDQCWVPVVKNWAPYPKQTIFVDETQDLNRCQIELAMLIGRRGGRLVVVGDPYQSIYGFRGADTDAMPSLIERLRGTRRGVRVLPLSVCYRCPQDVVKLVQSLHLVPGIQAHDGAAKGEVVEVSVLQFLPDVRRLWEAGERSLGVLCRVNSDLVKPCLRLIADGIRATIRGRDIGANLIRLVEKCNPAGNESLADLYRALQVYEERESQKLLAADKEAQAEDLRDSVATLVALGDGMGNVAALVARAQSIFSDDDSAGQVVFSSIHKAKGLEWRHVYILRNDLLPGPWARQPWELQQERNLQYVAYTRAMHRLVFVGEPIPGNGKTEETETEPTSTSVTEAEAPAAAALEVLPPASAEKPAAASAKLLVLPDVLPSFPPPAPGREYVGCTRKDWETVRAAYETAGVPATLYRPRRWNQLALLVGGRVRVSTTVNDGATVSREKGANAIDIVLVDHAEGAPRGGHVKVLRTSGWQARVAERVNDLLRRAVREGGN